MGKVVLVSGLNGFVGHHLQVAFEKEKIKVVGLPHDLFYSYEQGLTKAVKDAHPDFIIHMASYGNMREHKNTDDIFSANLLGTYNLLKATKNIGYQQFINISTSSVLLAQQTMYSATKLGAEALCGAFADTYDLPIVSVRPFSIYGEGEQETHLIPRIFRSCLYREPLKLASNPRHDYVYVKDFVEILLDIVLNTTEYHISPIQVGTGVSTSNYKLMQLIEQITGRKANLVGEIEGYKYDTESWKADAKKGYVQFTPTNLKEGLQKVYESYKL